MGIEALKQASSVGVRSANGAQAAPLTAAAVRAIAADNGLSSVVEGIAAKSGRSTPPDGLFALARLLGEAAKQGDARANGAFKQLQSVSEVSNEMNRTLGEVYQAAAVPGGGDRWASPGGAACSKLTFNSTDRLSEALEETDIAYDLTLSDDERALTFAPHAAPGAPASSGVEVSLASGPFAKGKWVNASLLEAVKSDEQRAKLFTSGYNVDYSRPILVVNGKNESTPTVFAFAGRFDRQDGGKNTRFISAGSELQFHDMKQGGKVTLERQ